uniref:Doublecortin domain-containing protein n=1 Tax=Caenorhabditis tropicalis TaxID=1561998 RepID=A0A1I7TAI9_9PELO
MSSTALNHDSLKMVLQYMDPNTRILLSSRIPSIRSAEKEAPLKIEHLEIRSHIIRINDTFYGCGIYRVEDKVPYLISGRSELNHKWTCGVDEFGIPDYITKAGGMLPGNNGLHERNLFGFDDLENIPTNEGRLEKLKGRLEIEKQRYNQLQGYHPEKEQVSDDKHDSFELYRFKSSHCDQADAIGLFNKEALDLLKNEDMVKKAVEYMSKRIKQMENELLPFENKTRNIRPKFEIHVNKMRGKSEPCIIIERVKYAGDLHKAEDYLRDFIFAERQQPVVVKTLSFGDKNCLRLMPTDMKIKLTELKLFKATQLKVELVKAITDISSSPLEKVTKLGENQKPIGTCFLFSIFNPKEDFANRVLKFVKNEYADATEEDKCVNIQMKNSALLKICHEKDEKPRTSIRMEVVSVERPHDLTNIKIEPISYVMC